MRTLEDRCKVPTKRAEQTQPPNSFVFCNILLELLFIGHLKKNKLTAKTYV